VKIDVQGFEDQVIQGGQTTLARARVALVELSVEPLYDNQPLFHEVYERMVALGFRFRGAHNQLFHPQDGRVLQVDGIFTRDT
jgi:hypothetical protein